MFLLQAPEVRDTEVWTRLPDRFRRSGFRSDWADANRGGQPTDYFLEGPAFDGAGNLYLTSLQHTSEGGGETVMEGLKTARAKHSPNTLDEVLGKIAVLKRLGADPWNLDGIALVCQRACAQAIVNRPPSDSVPQAIT